ncbi:MAG: DUF1579 family protein [Planctomycetaceae bacterium]|nr:DUF1579 family protein [Planctomycetaceae bacterium]
MILRIFSVLCLLTLTLNLAPANADTPPELKVLGRLVGEWDGTVQNQKVTFDVTADWTLNGQLVEQKQVFQDGAVGLLIYGYDQASNQYFLNLHDSRGIHWMLKGDWDEATQTFTFKGRSGENDVTVKSTFRNQDTSDWTITLIGSGGEVTELRGTNRRAVK